MSRARTTALLFAALAVVLLTVVAVPAAVAGGGKKKKKNSAPDTVRPTLTISRASGQADPAGKAAVRFAVKFSERVTGFGTSDVHVDDTHDNAAVVSIAPAKKDKTLYTVSVNGMSAEGTVSATVPSNVVQDKAGNMNVAAPTEASIDYDRISPTVTIDPASGQADPTNGSTIHFTTQFSEAVQGFDGTDVGINGPPLTPKQRKKQKRAAALTATVTDSGNHQRFDVAVTGYSGTGTIAVQLASGAAQDDAGNPSTAATSDAVSYDRTAPAVTINQASGQADPTTSSPIHFTAQFSEPVSSFGGSDVSLGGTATGLKAATVTDSGDHQRYDVAVSGMTGPGTVSAAIGAGGAQDAAGNGNTASTSTDAAVSYAGGTTTTLGGGPDVTVNQASGQADPTSSTTVHFTAQFSAAVTGFTSGDVTVGGTAGGTKTVTVTDSGDHQRYDIAVAGLSSDGTVTASIGAGKASDELGNPNTASTSTDNTVTYAAGGSPAPQGATPVTVTVNQASGQADPTSSTTVHFTAQFSAAVTGFTSGDVTVGGTAGGTKTVTVTDSGDHQRYDIAVAGLSSDGTVTASIGAGKATDSIGTANDASTSTDNTVTYSAPSTPAPSGSAWFASSSPWRTPVGSNPSVVSQSATWINSLYNAIPQINVNQGSWTPPVYTASSSDPTQTMVNGDGWTVDNVPIPSSLQTDPTSDAHAIILDPSHGLEYDFFQLRKNSSNQWTFSAADVVRTNGSGWWDGAYCSGGTCGPWGARASGAALGGGLILPQEVADGVIPHALACAAPNALIGPAVSPARTSDGKGGSGALPMGSHLQLDPSLDVNSLGLSSGEEMLARAMQVYGLYVVDSSGTIACYAQNYMTMGSNPYPSSWSNGLTKELVKKMRVLAPPSAPDYDNRANIGQPHR